MSCKSEQATVIRELTVAEVIEKLRELPPYMRVSPLVDGVAGVGVDVWVTYMADANENVALIGERPQSMETVPAEWVGR